MINKITMTEAATEVQYQQFWKSYCNYMKQDIFPGDSLGTALTEKDRQEFISESRRDFIREFCARKTDPGKILFFLQDGKEIGFCFYCTYLSEDAKCFILDFCIYEEYREQGNGGKAFHVFQEKAMKEGAEYFELNVSGEKNKHFWEKQKFQYNGYDSYGTMLLVSPGREANDVVCRYEELSQEDVWQIMNLLNGYKSEIEEEFLEKHQQEELEKAIRSRQIQFIVAKYKTRVVGMCSVSKIFSTFQCQEGGIFEDFYIEPVFRKHGIAKGLTGFAFEWCKKEDIRFLWVSSADCDMEMYQNLGFSIPLGNLLTWDGE